MAQQQLAAANLIAHGLDPRLARYDIVSHLLSLLFFKPPTNS